MTHLHQNDTKPSRIVRVLPKTGGHIEHAITSVYPAVQLRKRILKNPHNFLILKVE
jgi:hypothetical protein